MVRRPSVVRLSVNFYIFDISSETTGQIMMKLYRKHQYHLLNRVCDFGCQGINNKVTVTLRFKNLKKSSCQKPQQLEKNWFDIQHQHQESHIICDFREILSKFGSRIFCVYFGTLCLSTLFAVSWQLLLPCKWGFQF